MNTGEYNHKDIEKKWQDWWQEHHTYQVENTVKGKENFYALSEFAYPSGNLHVGHWYAFAVPDIYARYKRMQGYNVLYPMGFDAFGLPAENAAIKHNLDPRKWTYENMDYMKNQLRSMGASFDWSRTLATSDPDYYGWTQWMFNQFFKEGLVYRDITKVNWCENDKTILANEQVIGGKCERCEGDVIQKDMAQWMLKITDFADDLYDDLEGLNWDESIKQAQREWIGRKEGSIISFPIELPVRQLGEEQTNSKERNIVKVILLNQHNQVLVMESVSEGSMDLPGGGIELGETLEESAVRELQEETEYTNFEYVRTLSPNRVHYYHKMLDQHFHGNVHTLVYRLKDDEKTPKSLEQYEVETKEEWWNLDDVIENFVENPVYGFYIRESLIDYRNSKINVFTTRADTLFGATYLVLAPEHDMVQNLKSHITNWDEVKAYLKDVEKKSDLDRQQSREKTGVQLQGIEVINPATNEPIPVWVADYVLAHFGTGAVMAVPAHDECDCEFALKYDLPFKFVVLPSAGEIGNSRPLITSGENAFIHAAGTTEKKGTQEQINAEWNAMYDLLGVHDDGILPEGKRFCCDFEGKLINSPSVTSVTTGNFEFLGFNHPKDGKDWIERTRVYAIVKQKDTEMYLGLRSKTDDTQGLVTGGVDEGEVAEQAIVRELLEETGFTGKAIRKEKYKIHDKYYSTNKDKNILSVGDVFVLEVSDIDNRQSIEQEEIDKHEPVWLTKQEFLDFINPPSHKFIIKNYFNDSSGNFNTQTSEEARKNITTSVGGTITKTYRLRDWGISRQRYWGCPIPIVYDPDGNSHPIPDEHLPWLLPDDVDHTPDGTAPLARSEELQKRTEDIFGAGWKPEVDTMDTFVDSSWYFYRYLDNQNDTAFASPDAMKSWMPVDMYFGGAEHTTMHLLYSRFWVKALKKIGLVHENEPYKGRLNRGLILGPDGAKMSKSKGNVIDPDEVVSHVGADTVRMYLAFIGPFNEPGSYPWDPNGVVGIRRFLDRVWRLQENITDTTDESLISDLHQTIKKVGDDIERLKLNTAISTMMTFVNKAEKSLGITQSDYLTLVQLLAPFAPHMTEELWMQHHDTSIHLSDFPKYDESKISFGMTALPIQINGKVRAQVVVEEGESDADVQNRILAMPEVTKWTEGKELKKFIHVPGKIINLVV